MKTFRHISKRLLPLILALSTNASLASDKVQPKECSLLDYTKDGKCLESILRKDESVRYNGSSRLGYYSHSNYRTTFLVSMENQGIFSRNLDLSQGLDYSEGLYVKLTYNGPKGRIRWTLETKNFDIGPIKDIKSIFDEIKKSDMANISFLDEETGTQYTLKDLKAQFAIFTAAVEEPVRDIADNMADTLDVAVDKIDKDKLNKDIAKFVLLSVLPRVDDGVITSDELKAIYDEGVDTVERVYNKRLNEEDKKKLEDDFNKLVDVVKNAANYMRVDEIIMEALKNRDNLYRFLRNSKINFREGKFVTFYDLYEAGGVIYEAITSGLVSKVEKDVNKVHAYARNTVRGKSRDDMTISQTIDDNTTLHTTWLLDSSIFLSLDYDFLADYRLDSIEKTESAYVKSEANVKFKAKGYENKAAGFLIHHVYNEEKAVSFGFNVENIKRENADIEMRGGLAVNGEDKYIKGNANILSKSVTTKTKRLTNHVNFDYDTDRYFLFLGNGISVDSVEVEEKNSSFDGNLLIDLGNAFEDSNEGIEYSSVKDSKKETKNYFRGKPAASYIVGIKEGGIQPFVAAQNYPYEDLSGGFYTNMKNIFTKLAYSNIRGIQLNSIYRLRGKGDNLDDFFISRDKIKANPYVGSLSLARDHEQNTFRKNRNLVAIRYNFEDETNKAGVVLTDFPCDTLYEFGYLRGEHTNGGSILLGYKGFSIGTDLEIGKYLDTKIMKYKINTKFSFTDSIIANVYAYKTTIAVPLLNTVKEKDVTILKKIGFDQKTIEEIGGRISYLF